MFDLYFSGVVLAVSCFFTIIIIVYYHKTDNLVVSSWATVILILLTVVLFLNDVEHENYALYWISVFPPVVYFLLGRKNATIVSLIYGTYLAIFILTKYNNWQPAEFKIESLINIIAATLAVISIISLYEVRRKDVMAILELKNRELGEVNDLLSNSKDDLRLILDSTAEAIYGTDEKGYCTFCNVSCIKLLRYKSEKDLLGKHMHTLIHHSTIDGKEIPIDDCNILKALSEKKGFYSDQEVFWRADGSFFNVEYYSYPQFRNNKLIGAVVTFMDNTEKKRNREEIEYLSTHDPLTSLYNRSYFEQKLNVLDKEENLPISVIFADVNGLKLTNDIFGHSAGDNLIKKCAKVFKDACTKEHIIARVGGDEFIAILIKTEESAALKIIKKVKEDLEEEKIEAIKYTMSMGLAVKENIEQSFERVIANAENDMYKQKIMCKKDISLDLLNTLINSLHEKNNREKHHSSAVSELCVAIGKKMGLEKTDLNKLKQAGFLHDIGKITLDDALISKKDELTSEERNKIRQHAVSGYRILSLFDFTLDLAESVYAHHERWDGLGYPKGLKEEEIPLMARIIAVAEAYDARIIYDNGSLENKKEALDEMKKLAGNRLDPSIVDCFIEILVKEN